MCVEYLLISVWAEGKLRAQHPHSVPEAINMAPQQKVERRTWIAVALTHRNEQIKKEKKNQAQGITFVTLTVRTLVSKHGSAGLALLYSFCLAKIPLDWIPFNLM